MSSVDVGSKQLKSTATQPTKLKRRKAARACVNCQRTHLTCDDQRPCARCVQRGMTDTCRDGARKRAKYLGATDPVTLPPEAHYISPSPAVKSKFDLPQVHVMDTPAAGSAPVLRLDPASIDRPNGSAVFSHQVPAHSIEDVPANVEMGTTAADLEYSVISRMIRRESDRNMSSSASPPTIEDSNIDLSNLLSMQESLLLENDNSLLGWADPEPRKPPAVVVNRSEPASLVQPLDARTSPRAIYLSVTAPYPYAPEFHRLLWYIKQRFAPENLMRIVGSLAKIRPSFIACTNSLTQDDLVFMEQCFQRTLLEHQRYFSYTATPTAIWRRTGRVAAVTDEFCTLTGWSREAMLNHFIIQVMNDAAAVRYFELFGEFSFNDTRGSLLTDCTFVTPDNRTIKAAAVLTVRRDLFGIPMMIIGNFLPILSS